MPAPNPPPTAAAKRPADGNEYRPLALNLGVHLKPKGYALWVPYTAGDTPVTIAYRTFLLYGARRLGNTAGMFFQYGKGLPLDCLN